MLYNIEHNGSTWVELHDNKTFSLNEQQTPLSSFCGILKEQTKVN